MACRCLLNIICRMFSVFLTLQNRQAISSRLSRLQWSFSFCLPAGWPINTAQNASLWLAPLSPREGCCWCFSPPICAGWRSLVVCSARESVSSSHQIGRSPIRWLLQRKQANIWAWPIWRPQAPLPYRVSKVLCWTGSMQPGPAHGWGIKGFSSLVQRVFS